MIVLPKYYYCDTTLLRVRCISSYWKIIREGSLEIAVGMIRPPINESIRLQRVTAASGQVHEVVDVAESRLRVAVRIGGVGQDLLWRDHSFLHGMPSYDRYS